MEMLVVVTIIAIAGAVVVPGVTSGLDTLRLRTTAERLGTTFRHARETALRHQVICQVTVDPAARTVELRELNRRGSEMPVTASRQWQMPVGIQVRAERTRTFLFAPDGSVPRIELLLGNTRGRTATVELDWLTALPKVVTQ